MKPRLSRLDQIYPGYSVFFITFCTHAKQSLVANPSVHDAFLSFCKGAQERHILVGRYVLMPDHIHLFVDFGDEMPISMWVKSLKNALSKTFRAQGHPAPHWQKGYFDHLVRSEETSEEKWRYVEQNPVRKALVSKCAIGLIKARLYPCRSTERKVSDGHRPPLH
jgi:REP element-mobilizing transposase RayT